ncbi:MAG TPA: pseudouridine synthase [Bdellovibrionales bacterium]|nr:pseudouridine synthase [Bdellovibrionales bacterium]
MTLFAVKCFAMSLPVLYADSDLVAVHKPAGLLVHRTLLDARATAFALQMVRDQIGAPVFPVHRLDRPTSGVLIFARSPETAARLGQAFQARQVKKRYLAIVRGVPRVEQQLVDHSLAEERDAICDARARQDKPKQPALTWVRRVASVELPVQVDKYPTSRYALVEARPETGRKHQIRRHLRHLGHPVVGDVNHGSGKHNRFFAEQLGVKRLLLACTEMSFAHPRSGEELVVRCELAEDFKRALGRLGWESYG